MKDRIAIWDITSKCNLKCAHCYNQERYWEKANLFPDIADEDIIVMIDKMIELKFTRIHLLGGEPLLCPNLKFIIEYGRKKGLEVSMVTNGTMLTLEQYKIFMDQGVLSINVSLDGTKKEDNDLIRGEGSYDIVVKNLKEIKEYRQQIGFRETLPMQMSFTLTSKNIKGSKDLVEFARSMGFDGVTLSYLSNEGKARDDYNNMAVSEKMKFSFIDSIMEDYKKYDDLDVFIDARGWLGEYIEKKHGIEIDVDTRGCKGGADQFYILADGTLLPCSPSGTSMGAFLSNLIPVNYPNIRTDSIEAIVNSKALRCFYNYANNYKTYCKIVPCNNCKYECRACPLLYHTKNVVSECVYAQNEIAKLEQAELTTIYEKQHNIRESRSEKYIDLVDFVSGDQYRINEMGMFIWDKINGFDTIGKILENISSFIDEEILFEQLTHEICDFIYELKKYKFIKKIE